MQILHVISFIVLMLVVNNVLPASDDAQPPFLTTQSMGRVKGTVIAPDEALIPEATVIIKGEHATQKVITNWRGTYDFHLPVGVYEISTEIPGWYPLRRAKFCVKPDTVTAITLAIFNNAFLRSLLGKLYQQIKLRVR